MAASTVLIVGEAGSGKSTSAETLPAGETFYINVMSKDLPYKGWKRGYKEWNKDNPAGNLFNCVDSAQILQALDYIDKKRPEIKYVVIDDNQYVAADYLMTKAKEIGYGKFTDAAQMIYRIATRGKAFRNDLMIFILNHSEPIPETTKMKAKTAGKMIDNQITYEGLFTVVLFTFKDSKPGGVTEYGFITNGDPNNTAKSPKGMFEAQRIPNDLLYVSQKIRTYQEEE